MKKVKSKTCLISVIMPVYNSGQYIADSIQSILYQTFSDFEFIIIDDCSTDNTWDIIQSFSDSRIITIRNKENIGNYPSRNIGMKKAMGKYIAVMDGDDIALLDRLWKQYHYLEKNTATLAIGTQFDFIGLDYKKKNPTAYEKIRAGLLYDNCFLHPSLLVRSEIMKQLNGYDEKYTYSSDYDLVCRISMLGKIENIPDTCMLYRWHQDQISHKKALQQREFADDIRQRHQIAFINKNKSSDLPDVGNAEVGHPDIGRVIGLYIMGKSFHEEARTDCHASLAMTTYQADELLNNILDNIDKSIPLRIKRGLLGIGMGLIYLLRNNFVGGDEDEVLESIDREVFLSMIYFNENQSMDWEGVSAYLRKRASLQNSKNVLIQLNVRKTALHLIDIYKKYIKSDNATISDRLNQGLDGFCKDNLFRSLILSIREEARIDCRASLAMTYQGNSKNSDVIKTDSVTFVIPVRFDSKERYSNLLVVIDSLLEIYNSEVIIIEADTTSKFDKERCDDRVQHHFIEDSDPVFYRTKYINRLLELSSNSVVGIWDADVVFPKEQIEESIRQIKEGRAIMSFPYNGYFYVLSPDISDNFRKNRDFRIFDEQKDKISLPFGTSSVGGAFVVNKDVYCQIGGENEHFYGWGAEDLERVKRLEVLGYKIHRSAGGLYHLFHPRNNSSYANEDIEIASLSELIKISNMSAEELTRYVKTWDWKFDQSLIT
jgi:Glycosyltransferases involved in cell wall biogenesis